MSETPIDEEAEKHAYQITRKLFFITLVGTVVFSAVVAIFFL